MALFGLLYVKLTLIKHSRFRAWYWIFEIPYNFESDENPSFIISLHVYIFLEVLLVLLHKVFLNSSNSRIIYVVTSAARNEKRKTGTEVSRMTFVTTLFIITTLFTIIVLFIIRILIILLKQILKYLFINIDFHICGCSHQILYWQHVYTRFKCPTESKTRNICFNDK